MTDEHSCYVNGLCCQMNTKHYTAFGIELGMWVHKHLKFVACNSLKFHPSPNPEVEYGVLDPHTTNSNLLYSNIKFIK